jgi:multidrug efflux pump subunit AcrA (membrane-fusion protein)
MKRKILIIGGVVVVLLIVGGVILWQNLDARASASSVSPQTATVQRGSLVATINVAGNVSAPATVALGFQQSGSVAKVNVNVSNAVKKGQALMELDTTDLNLALKTAKANLASAQASYDQTKADLQFALRNAQASLDSSKADLDAARAKNDQNPNSLIVAEATLDKATVALQKAQADYNTIAWRGDVGMTSQAVTLQQAMITNLRLPTTISRRQRSTIPPSNRRRRNTTVLRLRSNKRKRISIQNSFPRRRNSITRRSRWSKPSAISTRRRSAPRSMGLFRR